MRTFTPEEIKKIEDYTGKKYTEEDLKNITEEDCEAAEEILSGKVKEMSDEELDKVSGGFYVEPDRPGCSMEYRIDYVIRSKM